MIYTITFNPSLDYLMQVDHFTVGEVNKTRSDDMQAGGKGLNVSRILNELGVQSVAITFLAGFVGQEIERQMNKTDVDCHYIYLKEGNSRINVKIQEKKETQINAAGPKIDAEAMEEFWDILEEVQAGDMVILAGSIPQSVSRNIYKDITRKMIEKGAKVVVDASGSILHDIINLKPYLLKPNQDELYELFDVRVNTIEEARNYAKKLHEMGACNAIISLGEAGAVLAAEDGKIYSCSAPRGSLVNSIGAGDSMIAGFLTGMLAEVGYEDALKLAVASGSATTFSKSLATKKEIQELYESM